VRETTDDLRSKSATVSWPLASRLARNSRLLEGAGRQNSFVPVVDRSTAADSGEACSTLLPEGERKSPKQVSPKTFGSGRGAGSGTAR